MYEMIPRFCYRSQTGYLPRSRLVISAKLPHNEPANQALTTAGQGRTWFAFSCFRPPLETDILPTIAARHLPDLEFPEGILFPKKKKDTTCTMR